MKQTYTGGCHCGQVRYTVSVDLKQVIECNCTHCSIKGLLLVFVPAEDFQVLAGEENTREYQFNKKRIMHLFCPTCGVQPYARGEDKDGHPTVAVNVRTLKEVDLTTLERIPFDGLHLL